MYLMSGSKADKLLGPVGLVVLEVVVVVLTVALLVVVGLFVVALPHPWRPQSEDATALQTTNFINSAMANAALS